MIKVKHMKKVPYPEEIMFFFFFFAINHKEKELNKLLAYLQVHTEYAYNIETSKNFSYIFYIHRKGNYKSANTLFI